MFYRNYAGSYLLELFWLIRESMGTVLAAMRVPVVTRRSNHWGEALCLFKDGWSILLDCGFSSVVFIFFD
jgi:hypothetical protein